MNQLTKYILCFLFISISGYSQEGDKRFLTELNPERFLPELNDIEKVKYVKTVYYEADSKGNFLKEIEYSGQEPEIFINEYPYRYLYKILPGTTDTISKIIFKYSKKTNKLEYVNEQRTQFYIYKNKGNHYGYNQIHRQYNKNGEIIKEDIYSENQLSSLRKWIYNSNNQLIRKEDFRYYEDKVSYRYITHYLYDYRNRLERKIMKSNDEITQIISWEYDENNKYHITEERNYKNSVEQLKSGVPTSGSSIDKRNGGSILIEELFDQNNNWIKKTYQNRYGYYSREREIIYK